MHNSASWNACSLGTEALHTLSDNNRGNISGGGGSGKSDSPTEEAAAAAVAAVDSGDEAAGGKRPKGGSRSSATGSAGGSGSGKGLPGGRGSGLSRSVFGVGGSLISDGKCLLPCGCPWRYCVYAVLICGFARDLRFSVHSGSGRGFTRSWASEPDGRPSKRQRAESPPLPPRSLSDPGAGLRRTSSASAVGLQAMRGSNGGSNEALQRQPSGNIGGGNSPAIAGTAAANEGFPGHNSVVDVHPASKLVSDVPQVCFPVVHVYLAIDGSCPGADTASTFPAAAAGEERDRQRIREQWLLGGQGEPAHEDLAVQSIREFDTADVQVSNGETLRLRHGTVTDLRRNILRTDLKPTTCCDFPFVTGEAQAGQLDCGAVLPVGAAAQRHHRAHAALALRH